MKHYASIVRIFIAAIILSLSTASEIHEVLHHSHGEEPHEIAAPSEHSEHSNNCEFCAKGPAASLESITVEFASYIQPQVTSIDESPLAFSQGAISVIKLRGPPIA